MRISLLLFIFLPVLAQPPAVVPPQNNNDQVLKAVDELEWRLKLSDIADVDKVQYASLPPHRNPNPTAPGAGNPLIVHAYTFTPNKLDPTTKHPLLALIHGGAPATFTSDP